MKLDDPWKDGLANLQKSVDKMVQELQYIREVELDLLKQGQVDKFMEAHAANFESSGFADAWQRMAGTHGNAGIGGRMQALRGWAVAAIGG